MTLHYLGGQGDTFLGFFLCPTCILSGGNIRHFIDAGELAGFEHTNSASVSTEPSSGKNQEFEDEKKLLLLYSNR